LTAKNVKNDTGIDQTLIKALAHPYRVHALHILNQRVASPTEIAQEVGAEVGLMAYHVRVLEKHGFIELVDTAQVRGATEHFYKATKRAIFSDDEWARIPASLRGSIVGMELVATGELLTDSIRSGSFERRPNRHHSLYELVVDQEGWDQSMELLGETMARINEIQATSAERRLDSDAPGIPMAISIIGFEKARSQNGK
jgi:DNA-binding transcriptional ArsR family regulator